MQAQSSMKLMYGVQAVLSIDLQPRLPSLIGYVLVHLI
jgi:hypothetical protein